MMTIHSCKTKTHPETCLTTLSDQEHLRQVKESVRSVRVEDAYYKLLQHSSCVRIEQVDHTICLPLKRNLFGLFSIPIQIGSTTLTFLLDTGAQISGIRTHMVDKLHLMKTDGTLSVGSAGGKDKEMEGYLIDTLQLGEVKVHQLPVIALKQEEFSMRFGEIDLFSFDGILGWDILSKLDFEIDDVAKQFKILKNRFRFTYENMIPAAFPLLFVKDDQGRVLTMGIDTGAKVGWMNEACATSLNYEISESYQMLGYGVHGMEKMDIKIIKEVNFYLYKAHVKIKNMHTGRTNIFPNLTINGILGNEVFRNRRIRFLNSKCMILLA